MRVDFFLSFFLQAEDFAYVKPKMGVNQFGGASVTYEGVGGTKKWERLESYGPKFCENITQAIARDILMYAMQTLRNCNIVAHVHDEVIIECRKDMSLDAVCEQMGRTPPWAKRVCFFVLTAMNVSFIKRLMKNVLFNLLPRLHGRRCFLCRLQN